MIPDLKQTERTARRLHGFTSERKLEKVTTALNEQLERVGLEGEVVSVLVYDGHGKINCYGRRLPDGVLSDRLNLTSGTRGTRVTGRLSFPPIERLTSYEKGYFVHLETLGLISTEEDHDTYAALVNIEINPDTDGLVKFP